MSKVDYSLASYERPKLKTPNGEKKLLLHSCCAPCAGEIMEALAASELIPRYIFIIPIFILLMSMSIEKKRISALLKN